MEKHFGNIVDIVSKKTIKGFVEIDNGVVKNIVQCNTNSSVFIVPGLIDSHIHIESSMLIPSEFAKEVVRHGTTSVVSDPHEIANVLGMSGVEFMINNGKNVPVKFYFGAPSCVPATSFESSGASLGNEEVENLLKRNDIFYLSEMMNFPGVIYNNNSVIKKISSAKKYKKPIDGHAPGLSGGHLKKYIQAGINTDHECFTIEEAEEKISLGMSIQIREGSAAKNFKALYPLLVNYPEKVMFCSDDLHPDDLVKGHINLLIKKLINKKIDIFTILKAVISNPIKHYGLKSGQLQIGDPADFIVVDNLKNWNILETYIDGICVYKNKKVLFDCPKVKAINNFYATIISEKDIVVPVKSKKRINVIGVKDGELVTDKLLILPKIKENNIVADVDKDILKIVVLNRYKKAKPQVGFVKNFGLKKGAIASSIAHDSHNIIAVGVSDKFITKAINEIVLMNGGIVSLNNDVVEKLALPIAGIMTDRSAEEVASDYKKISKMAIKMGSNLQAPFMTLSFMALLVIPSLKISDKGLFDVDAFDFVNIQD